MASRATVNALPLLCCQSRKKRPYFSILGTIRRHHLSYNSTYIRFGILNWKRWRVTNGMSQKKCFLSLFKCGTDDHRMGKSFNGFQKKLLTWFFNTHNFVSRPIFKKKCTNRQLLLLLLRDIQKKGGKKVFYQAAE